MTATPQQARFVFDEWHRLITARDGVGLAALYTADAVLESPLAPRVLDSNSGVVHGGDGLEEFISEVTRRRPEEDQLPSLYRTGDFMFDGQTLIWEYPRETPRDDQLDLVEVMELEGPRIRRHRIYWGWRGTEHILANALAKATRPADGSSNDCATT